mgnify:CR=1 FL=1
MDGQLSIFDLTRAAIWKYDNELGIAYFCPDCKRFICSSGKCKCGNYVDLDLPKKQYKGKVNWN